MNEIMAIFNLTTSIINLILFSLLIKYTKDLLLLLEMRRNPGFLHDLTYLKSMEEYWKK